MHEQIRTYKKLELDDNPQSANHLIVELPNTLSWISGELCTESSLVSTRNKRVLICCSAGRSRSVAVAMAYLMATQDINSKEALEFIQSKRPVANPNPGFTKVLNSIDLIACRL